MNLHIQANLPAQNSEHQRRGQVSIGRRKNLYALAAQQIVGVRIPALNGEKNAEGFLARRGNLRRTIFRRWFLRARLARNTHSAAVPRRVVRLSGLPRKNSAT